MGEGVRDGAKEAYGGGGGREGGGGKGKLMFVCNRREITDTCKQRLDLA